jgi:predicted flap endonuclease-1-like 5' DNA nuclease
MQDAFLKLIEGDFYQNAAFVIIMLLFFLLGILVWALLAHFPASRKFKKQSEVLESENKALNKDNKDFSERYTVVNAKFNRVNEDLHTSMANLKEKNEKVKKQEETIRLTSDQLELYKDNTRNSKEDNEKLLEAYKTQSTKYEKLEGQIEGMKGIVEEVEEEKGRLVRENQVAVESHEVAARKLNTSTGNLSQANETVDLLKKDLDAALAQKAELKKMVLNLEEAEQLSGTDDSELKTKLIGLNAHVRELELENSDLMERLAPYIAKELTDQRRDEDIDELLVNLFVDAAQNMETDGFYVGYKEEELIEDKSYLEKTLGEQAAEKSPVNDTKEEVVLLDVEDEVSMDEAMRHATTAMSLQGFYADIDKAVLIQGNETEKLSDDALMDKYLAYTAELFETSFFHNEEANEEGFIENEAKLVTELEKIQPIEHPADREEAVVVLDTADHSDMDAALEVASTAMDAEGLYSPIDSQKLIGTDDDFEEDRSNEEYQNDLEQLVAQEVGKSISRASISDKNDLKKIDGIGMFVEQRLNSFGIYTYKQVSQFDVAFIAKIAAALGFPEQTILRDKWVKQSKDLL